TNDGSTNHQRPPSRWSAKVCQSWPGQNVPALYRRQNAATVLAIKDRRTAQEHPLRSPRRALTAKEGSRSSRFELFAEVGARAFRGDVCSSRCRCVKAYQSV